MSNWDPLQRLEDLTLTLAVREAYEGANRRGLLITHGFGGIATTLLMLAFAPSATMTALLEAFLLPFTLMPCLGGFVLLVGVMWDRKVPLELAGMGALLTWDVVAAVVFGTAAWVANADGDPLTMPVAYPVAIYATLSILMVMHLRTAVKLLRRGVSA